MIDLLVLKLFSDLPVKVSKSNRLVVANKVSIEVKVPHKWSDFNVLVFFYS